MNQQPLRVLVADDEQIARKRMIRLLSAIDDIALCGECSDGNEVLARVKEGGIDVVLLDVQMPNLDGLETAQLLPENGPQIVVCTAYSEHALAAFEHGAVDYIVKPVEVGRLRKAMDRARRRRDGTPVDLTSSSNNDPVNKPLERLAIPTRAGIVLLDPSSVSHATLEGELVKIVTTEGEYLSDEPLSEILARLPSERFERVHRRAVVNLAQVNRLEPNEVGGYWAHMRTGQIVEVSRQSARDLRRRLGLR